MHLLLEGCPSWEAVALGDSFIIISCRFLFVKYFFKVFWDFFQKRNASVKILGKLSKIAWRTLTNDTIFKVLCLSFDLRLTRQLDYIIIPCDKCQHLFCDLATCLFSPPDWIKLIEKADHNSQLSTHNRQIEYLPFHTKNKKEYCVCNTPLFWWATGGSNSGPFD